MSANSKTRKEVLVHVKPIGVCLSGGYKIRFLQGCERDRALSSEDSWNKQNCPHIQTRSPYVAQDILELVVLMLGL